MSGMLCRTVSKLAKTTLNLNHYIKGLRYASVFTKNGREEAVVLSEDENIIVCWHPPPEFPYEFSRPLPPEKENADILRMKHDRSLRPLKKLHPFYEMKLLQEITFTNKHIWFPRPRDKLIKFKEKEPKDREYL